VGSFSTKNPRKYEIAFTPPGAPRIMAYFDFCPYIPRYATVTFLL
jgi:hypothetical protein